MRYAKSFVATFAVAFAFAVSVDGFQTDAAQGPTTSAVTYPDGVEVTISRPGYPDVI